MSIRYVPPSKHVGQITQFHRSHARGSLQARLTLPCRAVTRIVQKLFARTIFRIDPVEADALSLSVGCVYPAGHSRHRVLPSRDWKNPLGHDLHPDPLKSAKVPLLHGVHLIALEKDENPAGHSWHMLVGGFSPYVPALQLKKQVPLQLM